MKTKQDNIFSSKTLTYFLQLAETMSYTQAAQILGITQPALTQQIKKLERTVGAPLFYSIGKKLHLSDAGYTMLDATHQIYETLNKATDEIQQSTNAFEGKITIGILSSIESTVFSEFCMEYYDRHKQILFSIHMLTRKEVWERLENNTIDLAVMYLPDASIKNWKPYLTKKIMTENLICIHNDPALAKRRHVRLEDLPTDNWVTYPKGYYLYDLLHERYKNAMIDYPESVAHMVTPEQIYNFTKRIKGRTALPESFVKAYGNPADGLMAKFEPEINFDLAFVYRRGKEEIPRIKAFLGEFGQFIAKKSYQQRLTELTNQG